MKKSVLFSFFALLFATFGFGGISHAAITFQFYASNDAESPCYTTTTPQYNQSPNQDAYYTLYNYDDELLNNCASTVGKTFLGYKMARENDDSNSRRHIDNTIDTNSDAGPQVDIDEIYRPVKYVFSTNDVILKAYAQWGTGISEINITGPSSISSGDTFVELEIDTEDDGLALRYDWYEYNNNSWIETDDTIATGGKHYGVMVYLTTENDISSTATINYNGVNWIGSGATEFSASDKYVIIDLGVCPEEEVSSSTINSVSVSNIYLPPVGNSAGPGNYGMTYGSDTYTAPYGSNYCLVNGNECTDLTVDDTIIEGNTYRMKITLQRVGDILFNPNMTDDDVSINGSGGHIEGFDWGNTFLTISLDFVATATSNTTISTINLFGPGSVAENDDWDDWTIYATDNSYTTGAYQPLEWNNTAWANATHETAVSGYDVGFKIRLFPVSGYEFAESPIIKYNGVTWNNSGHTQYDSTYNVVYIDLGMVGSTTSAQPETTGGENTGGAVETTTGTVQEVTQTTSSGGGSGGGSSRAASPSNTNTENKQVEKTDDVDMTPTINELSINNDYLREELENNKELYKNAPLKVFVALYNLKKYDIFSLKQTAEAYNQASEDKKQKLLATLELLNKNDSKRAKYVVDYFKYIAGIE